MKNIETNRLIIRQFSMDDVQKVFELSREKSLAKWLPDQVYENLGDAKENLMFLISKYEHNTFPLVMAIAEKDTGELIGHVGLSQVKQGIEIGYAVGTSHQGKGYAKEAISAYIEWAEDTLKLKKIYGIADNKNIASCKVLEAVGFEKEDCTGHEDHSDKIIYIKS